MKRLSLSFVALASLSACLDYTPMYKVGASTQEANVTRAQCNTYAANTVPPMIINDLIPIFGADGRVIGYRNEIYDANEGRRNSAVQRCMEQQGYSRVSIPYCPKEALEGRNYRPLTTSPPLGPSICAVRQSGGSRVLVDLNKPVN